MKRFHISIAVEHFAAALADYTQRLGCPPCLVEPGRFALWRTGLLNFTISCKRGQEAGIRHVGFEDEEQRQWREETDAAGITWEYFSPQMQMEEIRAKFPLATGTGEA